jgi:hypothetical protein
MRKILGVCAAAAVSILLTVHPAHAQGYVAPSVGVALGNQSGQGRATFGVDFGWLSLRDPIGVDLDVVYAPSFFGNAGRYGENSVTSVMGNVMLAGGGGRRYGFGRRRGASARPYVSGGVGVLHEISTVGDARVGNNDLGVNLGAGVMAFSRSGVGVRADVRYFRNLVTTETADTGAVDFGAFHFWRASLGVVLGF